MRKRTNTVQIDLTNQAPAPIQLINNFESHPDEASETEQGTISAEPPLSPSSKPWVRNVYIGDCTIVKGSGSYKYVEWKIMIETNQGGLKYKIFKRYSDFVKLRELLILYFPKNKTEIPELPEKRILKDNFDQKFLRKRGRGLEYFLSGVLLNPLFSRSSVVRDFITK